MTASIREINQKSRSHRQFDGSVILSRETLLDLVETARFCSSGGNLQPLRYVLCDTEEKREKIFPLTNWARLLKDFPGPGKRERPGGYLVICTDKTMGEPQSFSTDVGIAAQTIMFAAVEKGLGGCMIASFNRQKFSELFSLPDTLAPVLVLALGKPADTVLLEDLEVGKNTDYYRDAQGHHVPKRRLEDIVL